MKGRFAPIKVLGLVCSKCKHVFKWIDERKPNFCPECGKAFINNDFIPRSFEV